MNKSSVINPQSLLRQLDQLQLEQFPLVQHPVAQLAIEERLQYVQILTQLLSINSLNESQQRLWQLLLQACNLTEQQVGLLTDTAAIGNEQWREVLTICERQQLAPALVLDILLLWRLNSINQSQTDILAELISLLKLTAADMLDLVHCSNLALGIEADSYQPVLAFNYDSIQHWHEFCYKKLDTTALLAGVDGGRWLLLDDVEINQHNISITNASIYGLAKKNLNVSGSEILIDNTQLAIENFSCKAGNIQINNSRLTTQLEFTDCITRLEKSQFSQKTIHFKGENAKLDIVGCEFSAQYESNCKDGGYLEIESGNTMIDGCVFEIKGASAIFVGDYFESYISIKNSSFNYCGAKDLIGGAIQAGYGGKLLLEKVKFEHCIAKQGGALNVTENYEEIKIIDCIFNHCGHKIEADNWQDYARSGGAIYIADIWSDVSVVTSSFTMAPLYLGSGGYGKVISMIDCYFKHSPIMYWKDCKIEQQKCSFENGAEQSIIINSGGN